ncbi:hypothetical protein N7455_000060 [Penicillium solitum]|uniref:uncharacterized protein n=1 Tax=Penicillium solitum TaxID=60172 RepID=UPI0032C41FAB|nr:hypothetical protein N7455_000060 [Penicillium solitum]
MIGGTRNEKHVLFNLNHPQISPYHPSKGDSCEDTRLRRTNLGSPANPTSSIISTPLRTFLRFVCLSKIIYNSCVS